MIRQALVASLAAVLVSATVVAAASGTDAGRGVNALRGSYEQCGVVTGQRGSAKVKQRNYNCDGARRLIETKLSVTGDPPGWTCRSDPDDFARLTCKKGSKRVKSKLVGAKQRLLNSSARADSDRPSVLCGNFGGETMDPHLDRKPARCDITVLSGVPSLDYLRHMKWTTWNEHPVGRGLVNGTSHTVRLKKTRPCGASGEFKVYSQMSIDDRPFRPILYCGD